MAISFAVYLILLPLGIIFVLNMNLLSLSTMECKKRIENLYIDI